MRALKKTAKVSKPRLRYIVKELYLIILMLSCIALFQIKHLQTDDGHLRDQYNMNTSTIHLLTCCIKQSLKRMQAMSNKFIVISNFRTGNKCNQ